MKRQLAPLWDGVARATDGYPIESLKAEYFDAEMATYDRLPQRYRDFMKDHGGFATDVEHMLQQKGRL